MVEYSMLWILATRLSLRLLTKIQTLECPDGASKNVSTVLSNNDQQLFWANLIEHATFE